jgi:hypothetical protein
MRFSGRTATAIVTFPPDKILLIKRATVPLRAIGLCQAEGLTKEKRLSTQ